MIEAVTLTFIGAIIKHWTRYSDKWPVNKALVSSSESMTSSVRDGGQGERPQRGGGFGGAVTGARVNVQNITEHFHRLYSSKQLE